VPRSSRRLENFAFLSFVTVLLLTMWGPALLLVNGLYVPEVLAPPLAVYVWARYPHTVRSILRSVFSLVGLAGAFWLSLVAVIGMVSTGSLIGPYSEWRASLVLLYSFIFMYRRGSERGQVWATRLMFVSFATLSLDALFVGTGILMPGFLGQALPDPSEAAVFGFGRVAVPALNIVVVSYLAARGRRIGLLAAALVLGGLLSLGGHRVVLAATAISALFVPLFMVGVVRARRMRGRWLRLAVAPTVIVAMAAAFRSSVIQNYLEEARGIQNRLFTHTSATLSGIKGGLTGSGPIEYGDETIRAAYAAYVLTQWPSLLLPHGLGSREVEGRLGAGFEVVALRWGVSSKGGNTHDNAVLYAAYHHGLLMTGFVTLPLAWLLLHRLRIERGLLGGVHVVVAVMGVVMVDMIYPPVPGINVACIYGLFLGTLLNPAALRPLPVPPRGRRREVRRRPGLG
jgi:hypothetical protein